MITIKEYAKNKGVSYEAVRKQLARYRKELSGHIVKQNRTQFLDDAAVEILDKHRQESVIIVQHEENAAEMQALREQVDALKTSLLQSQKKIIELQENKAVLIEYKAKYETMIEHKDENDKALQDAQNSLKQAQDAEAAAQKEVNSFKKTVFGLYRKDK